MDRHQIVDESRPLVDGSGHLVDGCPVAAVAVAEVLHPVVPNSIGFESVDAAAVVAVDLVDSGREHRIVAAAVGILGDSVPVVEGVAGVEEAVDLAEVDPVLAGEDSFGQVAEADTLVVGLGSGS